MYDIGLPSHKSIFQLHIERVMKVRMLASSSSSAGAGLDLPSIPIYIMTSDINDAAIRAYFAENNYFGYPARDVFFFEQALLPCLTFDGKIILESATSLSLAPGTCHAMPCVQYCTCTYLC
jgi:UDP-N-acetylglucosamine/UDP-N-acetylgalactosamine diphosphorylase